MKKKLSVMTIIMSLVVLFAGCAANPRDQYAKYIEDQQKSSFNANTFEMKIADLEMDMTGQEDTANPMTGMVMSQLKNIALKGEVQMDPKAKEDFSLKMTLDLMGMEIPFEMMGSMNEDFKLYMSTNTFSSFVEIGEAFGAPGLPSVESFASIKDKYIDLADLNEEEIAFDMKNYKKELKNSEEFSKAYVKEAMTYIKSLDKKSFVKKDDTITHTFTKDEIAELISLTQKVAKSDDKFKDYVAGEKIDTKEIFKELDDFSIETAINTKKNSSKMTVSLAPKAGTDAGFKSVKLAMNVQNSKNDKKVSMPKKADIVTMPELETLFGGMMKDQANLLGEELFNEEEFAEFKNEIKDSVSSLSADEKKMLLDAYKTMLSEAQYKELEELMK